jgi:steroid delta-isomerase-like uncharacterized protein
METLTKTNKEVVRDFYEVILNQRKLDLLDDIISEDYINVQGEQGAQAFRKTLEGLLAAFPDAHWKVENIIAEGHSVVVRHTLTGTHENAFQNIPATGKGFSNEGWALYELADGKIIRSHIQTDRLGFLQQIGVLPENPIIHATQSNANVYFVDKFLVPKNAVDVFTERMNYNRSIIKTIPGFIRDDVMVTKHENGDLTIMTVAVWETLDHVENGRKTVQKAYKKINFDPAEFTKRHGITMERQLYHVYN